MEKEIKILPKPDETKGYPGSHPPKPDSQPIPNTGQPSSPPPKPHPQIPKK